jgi:hypothetical protein
MPKASGEQGDLLRFLRLESRGCVGASDLTRLVVHVKKFAFFEHESRDMLKPTYRLPALPPSIVSHHVV